MTCPHTYRTDGEESVTGDAKTGCFPRNLLDNRDDLSSSSAVSDASGDDSSRDVHQLEAPTYLFIQMQLCRKESLKDWLAQNVRNRQQRVVSNYFQQVLEAVMYVHQKGLMHRDLKPSNIFFSLEGSVKVGDFGLVTGAAFSGSQGSLKGLKPPADDGVRHTGNIGSHFYMGPEQAAGKRYDQKVDIYSLGVIFFELHYPFVTEMERVKVLENLRQRDIPSKFLKAMPQESQLVRWLMEPKSSLRPTTPEITDSRLFRDLCKAAADAPDHRLIPKL
jgi:translation initiation factor 2-alpha kinase 3